LHLFFTVVALDPTLTKKIFELKKAQATEDRSFSRRKHPSLVKGQS
jgi:hypothetical protein